MKKLMNYTTAIILAVVFSLSLTSCDFHLKDYKPMEAFYRLMKVERRAQNLKKLNVSISEEEAVIETNLVDEKEKTIPIKITNESVYDVLIFTDVHFGKDYLNLGEYRRDKELFKALENTKSVSGEYLINTIKFAIGLGDFADHGLLKECEEYNKEIRDPLEKIYGIPLYNIVGNHDLYNSGWNAWEKTMYPHTSFYKFETPSFSWYFLDSASGTLGGYQYDALEEEMYLDKKKKLVFSHVPVYADNNLYFTMQNTEERNKLINTCAATSTQFFIDGHSHKERRFDFGAFIEQNIADFLTSNSYGILHINEGKGIAELYLHRY